MMCNLQTVSSIKMQKLYPDHMYKSCIIGQSNSSVVQLKALLKITLLGNNISKYKLNTY